MVKCSSSCCVCGVGVGVGLFWPAVAGEPKPFPLDVAGWSCGACMTAVAVEPWSFLLGVGAACGIVYVAVVLVLVVLLLLRGGLVGNASFLPQNPLLDVLQHRLHLLRVLCILLVFLPSDLGESV